MPTRFYKLYALGEDGQIFAPPSIIECDTEEMAIEAARAHAAEFPSLMMELWHGEQMLWTNSAPREAATP